MASPLLEEEGQLREWAPLTDLLQQIPIKAQRGIFTQDLYLTCVDILPEFIAVGTNLGLVYWYSRLKGDLQRLRCENTAYAITCVKIVSTVDFMVAAGNDNGIVTVFQIPKTHPDCIPESMKPKRNKQVERYTISGLHSAPVSTIEWSINGMKLFSGDKHGLVVLTELDFYMHLSKSMEVMNEKYEIVQLSYSHQLLLVSTLYRSIVCHREECWKVSQVGQKERKSLGKLGATFCPGSARPQDLIVYSSRPGLRLWLADQNGLVHKTLIYKDALSMTYPEAPLINPAPPHVRKSFGEHQFGPILVFRENLLVTYSSDIVYIINPETISIVATVSDLRAVKCVAVNKDEIFILEGERSLIRVAYAPDSTLVIALDTGSDPHLEKPFSTIPVSLSDATLGSTLYDLTSRLKDSAVLPAIPFQSIFNKDWNGIVTADEAVELPPVVDISSDDLSGLHTESELHKNHKEVFNRSQRSTLDVLHEANNIRAEVLDKIGEQDFERILFKPKAKRKNPSSKKKHNVVSEVESGSDTMSTNSVRSAASDLEDPCVSEILDPNSDWSNITNKSNTNQINQSQQIKMDDSTFSNLGIFSDSDTPDMEKSSASIDTRPDILDDLISGNNSRRTILSKIKPDLRSPASIERDVEDKEKILARVLDLDTLCLDHVKHDNDVTTNDMFEMISEELTHDLSINGIKSEECDDHCGIVEDKQDSMNSLISYGPPSGSSILISEPLQEPRSIDPEQYDAVERSDKWMQYKVPDAIANLSVCQNFVCCIDCKDTVYYSRLTGLGLRWQKLDYKAKQVSFSMSGSIVWKLVNNVAYALQNPSGKGPFGGDWHEAAHEVQCIAVDENIVWLVSLNGSINVQKLLNSKRPYSVTMPVACPWCVSQISCNRGAVWALTDLGEVIARIGVSVVNPEGRDWRRIVMPGVFVHDIALGTNNTGWVVSKNVIYFTNDYTETHPKWWQILVSDYIFQPSSTLQQFRNKIADNLLNMRLNTTTMIEVGEDTVWTAERLASSVHMNKTEFFGHRWNKVALKCFLPSTRWQKVSAEGIFENKGHLWLLSSAGDLFCSTPNSENLNVIGLLNGIPIACLAAAPQSLWLLNAQGNILVRQGLTDSCLEGTSWRELNLDQIQNVHLTHVSCGCDVAWACDKLGDVYMTIGSPHSIASSPLSPVWILVDQGVQRKHVFTKVFVGPHTFMVWAIDNKQNVYVREAIFNDYQVGTDWVLVLGIEAVHLTVTGSAVWALSPTGSIYRRFGISQNNYIGDYWQKIPGICVDITASVSDGVWAVDKSVGLVRHSQLSVKLASHETQGNDDLETTGGIDADEWEVV